MRCLEGCFFFCWLEGARGRTSDYSLLFLTCQGPFASNPQRTMAVTWIAAVPGAFVLSHRTKTILSSPAMTWK